MRASLCDVSVVITCFDNAPELSLCLRSLRKQRFSGTWEIVLCDDGSSDETRTRVISELKQLGIDSRYVWQDHKGARRARSRNNGIRNARGRIVLLLDGDLVVSSDWVAAHVNAHRGTPANGAVVYGSRKWIFKSDMPEGVPLESLINDYMLSERDDEELYSDRSYQDKYAFTERAWLGCFSCNLSFTKKCDVLFDESFEGWGLEDADFACRLLRYHQYKLIYKPDIVGFHLHDGSRSNFCSIQPASHYDIVQYIKNVCQFRRNHPGLDLSQVYVNLGFFAYNRKTSKWEKLSRPRFEDKHIREVLELAQQFGL